MITNCSKIMFVFETEVDRVFGPPKPLNRAVSFGEAELSLVIKTFRHVKWFFG